jgi:virginiamycin B lyase
MLPFVQAQPAEIVVKEWVIPTPNSAPHDIVVDKNGIVWFTEINTNKIGRFDPKTEEFKEYPITTPSARPHGLVVDGEGNVWFTEVGVGKIGMLIPQTGEMVEYATPTPNSGPHTPILAGDSVLWFTEQRASQIGRLDIESGEITEFPTLTPSANPYGIIVDAEGNAWFAELQGHHIGKVDAETGEVTEYAPPTAESGPRRIAIDSNGILWFTEYNAGKIGSFDPKTGEMLEYDTSSESSGPYAIWVDIYDNVWFSLTGIYKIGKFDQSTQKLYEYDLPSPQTHIKFIHTEDNGNVWFPNYNNNKIGVILADIQETSTNQSNSQYNFEIWAMGESVISQSWYSGVQGRICPSPKIDMSKNETIRDPDTGELIQNPDSFITVSFFMTKPDGTNTVIDTWSDTEIDCAGTILGARLEPEDDGTYKIYGTARWIFGGSVYEITSNEIAFSVQPAIYQTTVLEEFTPDIQVDRLLDWSSDGKSILVSSNVVDSESSQSENVLILISPDDGKQIKRIEMPVHFEWISDAKFSPTNKDLILLLGRENSENGGGLYTLDLSIDSIKKIADNSELNGISSAAWVLNDGNNELIVYGEETYSEFLMSRYNIWLVKTDGTKIEKLFDKSYDSGVESANQTDPRQYFFINDVSSDGKKILVSVSIPQNMPVLSGDLTVFDLENKQFKKIADLTDISLPVFSPSDKLIIYDIPTGYKTPGGPVVIMTADGTWREELRIDRERSPNDSTYDDPTSFVTSPDGRYVVAKIDQWGGGNYRLVKVELAHPVPEFGPPIALMLIAASIAVIVLATKPRVLRQRSRVCMR